MGVSRKPFGEFDRVVYDRVLINAPTALLNREVCVRLKWRLGSLNRILIEDKDEELARRILRLGASVLSLPDRSDPATSPR
jgi:hypothetical protein